MRLNTFILAAAAVGLSLTACSNDSTQGTDPLGPVTDGDPASFTLTINEPVTRADQQGNSLEAESRFVTADIFIFESNTLVKHARLERSDFTEVGTGNHVYETTDPIVTTTGEKEIYVGLNLPVALGKAMAAIPNKTSLYLLGNTDTYQLSSTSPTEGFVMFSTAPAIETLRADITNRITAKVGRLVAKVTVEKGPALNLTIDGGQLTDDLRFAIRNSNKLFWPYQKKENGIVYDPNCLASEWKATDFNQGTDYDLIDEYDTPVLDREVKYTPENTSQKIQRRETTYASVRTAFIPEYFTADDGTLKPNDSSAPKSFWVAKLKETGEVFYFDNQADALAFASDKATVSEEYKSGYCYYNLFLNPSEDFQTLRNSFYQLRILSITGLGNPNPEDEGDDEEPVTKPANLDFEVDIEPWVMYSDEYELY